MKRHARRPSLSPRAPTNHLVLVHPAPDTGSAILLVATRLLQQFAAKQGKEPPGLSVDAATFLARQRWEADELARRVWRAVETNCGSLITAADLS